MLFDFLTQNGADPMSLLDWLTKRKKPLTRMSRGELRRQELLLEKDRNRMFKKLKKIADDKQALFEKGAAEKTPEMRSAYAQEFELKTTEQLMISRQLNIRSKEVMTVSRLRMLRENTDRARKTGGKLGLVSEKDILMLGQLIENDAVKAEIYQERLDEVLRAGLGDDESTGPVSKAGKEVLNIWEQMDSGAISNTTEAFDEADRRVREHQRAAAQE